jgi:DNA-binding beta-propeller fold protein YncE
VVLLLAVAWLPLALAAPVDRSDMNNDGAVDTLDLEIFANTFLGQDWQTVDWCGFYESSITDEKYFRSITSDKTVNYQELLDFIALSYNCEATDPNDDRSDLNGDGFVDLSDLIIFSTNYLGRSWDSVDWCLFLDSTLAGADFEGQSTKFYLQHFELLLTFINSYFYCDGPEPPANNLQLENKPIDLVRIADAAYITNDYYITDPRIGSLFIYDENLVRKAEIKGLNRPLGVAVDSEGYILIGNDGRDNIEVYDPANGNLVAVFAEGLVKMPTAITIDDLGNIYVTDSRRDRVQVFDPAYNPVRTIGTASAQGTLDFPIDTEIIVRSGGGAANIHEIFVADQGNKRIQVYDLEGNWLRSLTFLGDDCSWFTGVCTVPAFTRLQALDTDSLGRLHVVDNYGASVLIFDPADGAFLDSYGSYGTDPGYLRVPMDVLISQTNKAIVTAGDGDRIEEFDIP